MSEYVRINRAYEVKWFPKIKKAINSKVSSLIDILNNSGIEAARRFLSHDLTNPALTEQVKQLYNEVGLRHARKAEVRLRQEIRGNKKEITIYSWFGEGEFFTVNESREFIVCDPIDVNKTDKLQLKRLGYSQEWIDFIQAYLRQFLIEKITFSVNETTRDELLRVLNESIQEGLGITQIVARLENLPFTEAQAARIVRTEVNRAANVGVVAQGNSFQYELQKGWIAVQDNRTRGVDPKDHADHIHMDGQWVDFYDVFRDPRNGHQLEHPGDPKAPPGDTVNCRCQMTTRPKRDERGRLIPKQSKVTVIRNFNTNNPVITI